MSTATGIEWTDATWNPVRGCSRISEGCRNCYAERVASRFSGPGQPYEGLTRDGRWTGEVRLVPEVLDWPMRRRKPMRIFVNSMSDLFHESLSNEEIERIFGVMALATQHTFQVLTKRPERMLDWFAAPGEFEDRETCVCRAAEFLGHKTWSKPGAVFAFDSRGSDVGKYSISVSITQGQASVRRPWPGWPLPNVHLGVSIEDQATADERIPLLLQTPAAVRFLSVEPMLGPVEFSNVTRRSDAVQQLGKRALSGIDGVIVGGESGPNARPCDVAWIRSVVEQCKAAAVPCFVKQLGSYAILDPRYDRTVPGWTRRLRDRKGGDPSEWPEDLRVRELPFVAPEDRA